MRPDPKPEKQEPGEPRPHPRYAEPGRESGPFALTNFRRAVEIAVNAVRRDKN